MRFEGAQPSAEEAAAIVAALSAVAPFDKLRMSEGGLGAIEPKPSPWKIAHRRPELDFDDLRSIR